MVISDGSFSTFTYIDSLLPSNINSQATGINDGGAVVGFFEDASGAFEGSRDAGGVVATVDVPGALSTKALGINDLGEIVGEYTDAGGVKHGSLDDAGAFTLIDFPGSAGTSVYGVNDLGQIVGYYSDARGLTVGFIGQQQAQAPEPTSLALMGIALAGLAATRRRKQ